MIPTTPEPFAAIPEELGKAASDAIAEVDWLAGATLEYVVISTDKGSTIFKAENIPEVVYKIEEIQDPAAGKIVRLPRWSSETGTELIDPAAEDVQQYIVIITSSPGSGNDCRRGGTCRAADGGG